MLHQTAFWSSVTGWTPASIATALWYDFGDSSTISIGSGISQVNDKSGNSRDGTQSTGAQQPSLISNAINGKSVARFNGSNSQRLNFDGSFMASINYLVFCVCSRSSVGNNYILGGNASSLNGNLHVGYDTTIIFHRQYSNDYSGSISSYSSSGIFDLLAFTHSSSAGKSIYKDGSSLATSADTTSLVSWAGATLGYRGDTGSGLNGDIAEIIILTGTNASSTNRQLLEGYAAHKFGQAANLPSGHPYKSSAP